MVKTVFNFQIGQFFPTTMCIATESERSEHIALDRKYFCYTLFEHPYFFKAILLLRTLLPSVLDISAPRPLMCLELHSETPSAFYSLEMLGANCLLIPTAMKLMEELGQ